MSFGDIKGQENAIQFLRAAANSGAVSHSYIFSGPSGVGRRLAAINFAKALNCLAPADGDACGACVQCRKIDSLNHPDLHVIKPVESRSLGIDEVRDIIKNISLKPYEGRRKVYIIDGADTLTHEAQNAFLKTLEEPPQDAVLILIAENVNALLSTIQSRSKRVRFFPLSGEILKSILTRRYQVGQERADLISRISAGRADKALEYNEEDFLEKRRRIIDGIKSGEVFDPGTGDISRQALRESLDIMLTWYRDMLLVKAGLPRSAPGFINVDRLDAISSEAAGMSFDRLDKIIDQIILTASLLEKSANPKLAMAVLGINVKG